MVEVGIFHRENKKWKPRKPVCHKSLLRPGSVSFFEAAPSFIFLAAGFILSFFIFLIECVIIKFYYIVNPNNL